MAKRIQLRRDIKANWESLNPILAQGEIGIDLDTQNLKIGDGTSRWNSIRYAIILGKLNSEFNENTFLEIGPLGQVNTLVLTNNSVETLKISDDSFLLNVKALFDDDTTSVDPYSGAVVVTGGVGIGGDLNVAGDITANKITVEESIEANLQGDTTGTHFGDIIGNVRANNGDIVLVNGNNGNLAIFSGQVNGRLVQTTGTSEISRANINGGLINSTVIGNTGPTLITGTTITATTKFLGVHEGKHIGDVYTQDGLTLVLDNGTGGPTNVQSYQPPVFYGNVQGNISGRFGGDIYAEDGITKILENGTGGSSGDPNYRKAEFIGNVTGDINSYGTSRLDNVDINNGYIDGTVIGFTAPRPITGTVVEATERFIGTFEGQIVGPSTGDIYSENKLKVFENGTDGLNAKAIADVVLYVPNLLNPANPTEITILDRGTNGTNALYTGNVLGNVQGDLLGDVTAENITTDDLTVNDNATIDNLSVELTTTLKGSVSATKNTSSTSTTTGTIVVTGGVGISENLNIGGNVDITGDLQVDGDANFTGIVTAPNLSYTGSLFSLSNPLNVVAPARFTVETSSGDTLIKGDLTVEGTTTLADLTLDNITVDNLTVNNDLDVDGISTLAEVDINSGTIDGTSIGATTPSTVKATHIDANSITIDNYGELRLRESTTNGNNYVGLRAPSEFLSSYTVTFPRVLGVDGSVLTLNRDGNKLEFASPDLFGGGQVSVSADYGDDAFDGVNKPVKTIKRALQIASGLVYSPKNQFDSEVCFRDVGLILESIAWDLIYGSNWQTVKSGITYSNATAALVLTAQKDITIRSLTYLSRQIVKLIGGAEASALAQSIQTIKTILANTDFGDIITPNQGAVPVVSMPDPAGSDTGFTNAKEHILANIDYIAAEVIGWITTNHPTFSYATNKCDRDVKYMAYSMAYDITYGGNSQTVDAARKYFSYGDEPTVISGEQAITQAAYQHMNYLVKQVVQNLNPATSYQNGINRVPNTNVASNSALTKIDDLFDIVDTTITSTVFSEPAVFFPNTTANSSLIPARNTLLANKTNLQISTVAYIADYRPNDKRIIIAVASGDYVEDNPIIIPDNVSVVGAGLRACNLRPANANKDMLRVRNGCYFTEITFRDKLDVNLVPSQTFDYAVAFDDPSDLTCSRTGYINLPNTKPVISISPYVQNCSIISFLGGNGVLVDGSKVATPNVPANRIEAENPVEGPIPQQGKSMVSNAFTMLSFGGTGWRVINDAYAQIVSCFQIFCLNGSYCQSGGYLSITNSATNFGQFALRATGYSPNAFDFNKGVVVSSGTASGGIPTLTAIGFGELPVQHYVVRVRDPIYRSTYNTILNNKEELADDLIDWIADQVTNNQSPYQIKIIDGIPTVFNYDTIKCKRDTILILDAVAYDLLSGGNNKTVEAGTSYATATSINLINQKEQNIAAFTRLKTLTLVFVPNDLKTIVGSYFDLLISIIDDIVNVPDIIDYSSRGDITNNYKSSDPADEIAFSATVVNVTDDSFNIVAHGFTSKLKLVYSSNSNPVIGGLTEGQSYYVKEINADNFKLYTDDSLTKPVNLIGTPTGTHKFIKNVREYFISDLTDSHQTYQELTLQAGVYAFVPGREIQGTTTGSPNKAYVFSYDPTTFRLIVSVERVQIGVVFIRNQFTLDSVITQDHNALTPSANINVDLAESIDNLYTATFKILPTQSGSSLTNLGTLPEKQLWLHRPSIVNSSSHTWEYAGSGVDYNALPQNGGRSRVEYEQVSELPGRVYTSGTNELGDFKVGDFIKAENKTGNVKFTNTVSIAALDALKLAVGNITIEEFSADIDLGDNEIGGPNHNRLSTQLAVRSFLENRLGNFIDREVSASNVPGAIPQLNSLGKLNADLIPPIRNFIVYRSKGYRSRLKLVDSIPAISVLGGDLSIEEYSSVQIVTNGTLTANDGDLITQTGTGAQGVVIGSSSSNTFILGSVTKTFNATFNTLGALTKNGSETGLTPTTVNTVIADQTANYILSELDVLQILLLDTTQTYNFTGITRLTSANNGAQGDITNLVLGTCNGLDNRAGIGLSGGSNYISPVGGVYEDVPLTGGSGTGARGDVFITNGIVTAVALSRIGTGYVVGDILSAATIDLGGGTPVTFSIKVSEIQNRLYLDILGGLRFGANILLNDFIQDANAVTKTIDQKGSSEKTFNAASTLVAGNVNTSLGRIIVTAHGYTDGTPIVYDSNGNTPVVPLIDETSYYVKVIDNNTIELYQNYSLQTKINITGSSSGTHKLTIKNINLDEKLFYLPNHGYTTSDPVRVTGVALPQALDNGSVYYVGSVTTNAFSLHKERTDSVLSLNGATIDPVDIEDTGLLSTGTMSITKQNIKIIGTIENSSILSDNWSALSANNVDANNIVSGLVNPSRLAVGQANNLTFLRGDSSWQRVVQRIKKFNENSAITITGNFETVNDKNEFYNEVTLDVDVVDSATGREVPEHPGHTNLGVARFNKAQFDVGTGVTTGRVSIRSGVIDAGTVDGLDSLDLLNSAYHTIQPVTKGGTAIANYTSGDMLYATSTDILQKLPIGSASNILTSNGAAPLWTDSITLSSVSVTGNLSNVGGASLFSANRINMQDNNLRLGVVSAISSRSGTINFTSVGATSTSITLDSGLSTAGLIVGMSLLRISGGVLGNNARITDINSPTTFTFSSDGGITQISGGAPITFSIGGVTDLTANGGGVTVKGATDKTFTWSQSLSSWSSSENLNLVSTKSYKINNVDVLTSTTLGTNIVNSSLTTVGTIGTGVWQGTVVNPTYGGTGVNNGSKTITLGGNLITSGAFDTTLISTAATSVTLPVIGTLATLAGTETLTNKTINKVTITTPATGSTLTIANGKTLTASNTLTFTGTDTSSVAFGTGGTVVYKASPTIDNPTLNLTYTGTGALTSVTLQSAYTTGFKSRFTSVDNNSSFSWLTNLNWSGVAWVKDNNAKGHWKIDKVVNTTDTTSYINFSYGGPTNVVSTDKLKIFGTGRTELLGNIASTTTTDGTLVVTGGVGISEILNIGSNLNVGGNAIITGNLTVNGTTTTVNSNTVNIGDNIIVLNVDEVGVPSQDAGIEIERGTSDNVSLLWDETNDKWTFGTAIVKAGSFEGAIAGNSTTATQLATSRNITLAGDVSGNAYFDGTADITINTTVTTNSIALGTDTTGNYVASVSSGTPGSQSGTSGLTISGSGEAATVSIAHADTSSVANLASDNSGTTFIQDVSFTFDTFGHVTAASVTTADVGNATLTLATSGNGISGSQTFAANSSTAATFTVASNATSANTASTIVFRDANGDFSARTITASLAGNASTSNLLVADDDRIKAPNDDAAGRLRFGFTSYANNNTAPYADYIHMRSYTDASGGNDNLLMFSKDAIGIRIWQQTYGSTTAYSTYKDVAFTDNIGNGTLTIQGNNGLTGSGTFTANQSAAGTITISHADTSSVADLASDNSVDTFIQDINFTFDTYGHVTGASVGTARTGFKNIGSIGIQAVVGSSVSCTTAQFLAWYQSTHTFKSYNYTVAKCSWDYAGNNDISDTSIGACEMAGSVIETFSDGTYYTIRITRPTTGVGGFVTLTYNDQGSSYSPGWRTDISSSNYNSFSPTLTGTGASGTWGINVTGNAATVSGLTPVQFFNNMGENHGTRTDFNASYGFGWRFIQGNTNGPGVNSAAQYYSQYVGLGNDYGATGVGSYGMQMAVPRNVATPYITIRYNENGSFAVWQKIAAGYADTAGSITSQANSATITATSANTGNTIVLRDASGNFSAGVMSGTATSARYADLAENYVADADYEEGTVLMFGGVHEVTLAINETRKVIGVISKNPAHLMNSELKADHVATIALQGRVPVKVKGKIVKGDMLVSAGDGYAKAHDDPRMGMVIGKALEDFDGEEGVIEVVVGRM